MDAPSSRSDGLVTAILVLAHAAVGLALVLTLLVVVPSFDKTFRDYGIRISEFTANVIFLSRWVQEYWFLLPFALMPVLAVDGAVLYLLRRADGTRWLSWCWFLLWLILSLVSGVIMLLSVWLPYRKLVEGLSK